MSAGVVNLQAQVESVLGALVRAATVELTKLFESRYRASALDAAAGRAEVKEEHGRLEAQGGSWWSGDTRRSIGVQVDEDDCPPVQSLCGPPFLSDCHSSEMVIIGECREEVEGCLILEILSPEDHGQADLEGSPLIEQVVANTVDMVDLSRFKVESPTDGDPHAEVVLETHHDSELKFSDETRTETSRCGSMRSSPTKQELLVIQPDTHDVISGEKKFVCPVILKSESQAPKPDGSEEPVEAEPQPACVSTAKGTAYSPSPSDGAVTPAQAGVWERIHTPKETKNSLHMTLKLTSPDQKLMRPCAVQLVNMLTVPESEVKLQDDVANHKSSWPLPKDLRRHQGLHTGHRLCCFTPCGNGVWRLQKVVTHSRDGYPCSICGKTFKRRKILRRHERFHSGEKPYSCLVCTKSFALRKSLRRHSRFHTGERPHTCTHCNKSFRLRDNLKTHLRFHTGEKPFSCSTCGKMFRIMKNLEKHQCELFVSSVRTIAGL